MANTNNQKETAEDKALERFTEMMIERVKEIQTDWKKPGPAGSMFVSLKKKSYLCISF